jgi:transposase
MLKLGHPKSLTPTQVAALNDWLTGRPDSYLDEMRYFLWDNFNVDVSLSTISRALKASEIT